MKYTALTLVPALMLLGAPIAQAADLNGVADHGRGFDDVDRAYPSMDPRYVREGASRTPQQLSQLAVGQTTEQVVAILGSPALTDSTGWHYNISLPMDRNDELVCQYKLQFNQDGTLAGGIWRRPQCAAIATQAPDA
ncbi:MAG: outer membrane protein assembly factor BamE [Sphingopyxis sp.]|nr:outer membrane protein assembly factor BamE [Sphingopyxis sp.]